MRTFTSRTTMHICTETSTQLLQTTCLSSELFDVRPLCQAESKSLSRPMSLPRRKYEAGIASLATSITIVSFAHVRRHCHLNNQIVILEVDLGVIVKEPEAQA